MLALFDVIGREAVAAVDCADPVAPVAVCLLALRPDERLQVPRGQARQFPAEPFWVAEPASCADRHDAINPAALFRGRNEGQPELLLEGSREDATYRVTLPTRRACHLGNRDTLGSTQHRDHLGLLRGALRIWLALRIRLKLGIPLGLRIRQRLKRGPPPGWGRLEPLADVGGCRKLGCELPFAAPKSIRTPANATRGAVDGSGI